MQMRKWKPRADKNKLFHNDSHSSTGNHYTKSRMECVHDIIQQLHSPQYTIGKR